MLFDFSGMPQPDQVRAQDGALKYLREQMSPNDVVAILTFANSLKVEQDFTSDRDIEALVNRRKLWTCHPHGMVQARASHRAVESAAR